MHEWMNIHKWIDELNGSINTWMNGYKDEWMNG